jgi:hypothetical protein
MATFNLISSVTVGAGGASTIGFTSIPATYTDLFVYLSGRIDSTFGNNWYDTYLQLNSTAGASIDLYGIGASVGSGNEPTSIRILGVPSSAAGSNIFCNVSIYITNYASTTIPKAINIDSVSENNAVSAASAIATGLYSSNTAISSLTLDPYLSGNFVQYSTAYLYGISNA